MKRKTIFIRPSLKDRKGDLTKQWFVELTYRDPKNDKMIRCRYVKGINDVNTIAGRKEIAAGIIRELNQKIKSGWLPCDDDKRVFNDKIEYKVVESFNNKKKANRTIRYVSSQYLEWKLPQLREKSYNGYLSKLRLLTHWAENFKYGDNDILFYTEEIIKMFFEFLCNNRNLDKRTVLKYRQNLHNFFEWVRVKYKMVENPVTDVMIPTKKVDMSARPIIQRDMDLLLDTIEYADPQLYLACLFQYYTAVRPGTEMRLLQIKDIDFYNSRLTVIMINAKRERHETVDIPNQLTELCINRYLLHTFNPNFYVFGRNKTPGPEPVGKNTLRNRFNAFRNYLKLPTHYKFYSMKHTGAGKLLESGATILEVKDHLRHISIEDTQKYVKQHFGERNKRVITQFPDPRSKPQ